MHILKIRFKSRHLAMPTYVAVLLPDSVTEDARKRKVLWFLHGAMQDYEDQLQDDAFMDAVKDRDLIVVIPDGLNSDFGNYEDFGNGYDFPSYFFDELLPFVYANFPASDEPADNFIAGASMGGFGAMELGLLHPEKFGGIAAIASSMRESEFLQPYLDSPMEDFKRDALENPKDFPTEYGFGQSGIKRKEVNVIAKYPTVQDFYDSPECMWNRFPEVVSAGNLPRLYVACGTDDLFYPPTRKFEEMAEDAGVKDSRFVFADGVGHEEPFFDVQLGESLDWFGMERR